MTSECVTFDDTNASGLPDALEIAWGETLKLVSGFLNAHDRFGFELVEKKSNPSLEDMLISLKTMGAILNSLDDARVFDGSDQRKLLNAKQQIVWFEKAVLALKEKNKTEYDEFIALMKNQAHF